MVELKHAKPSERLLRHILATVGGGDVGAEVKSVGAGPHGSQVEEDAEAKRDALLNAEEDASDEEEAAIARDARTTERGATRVIRRAEADRGDAVRRSDVATTLAMTSRRLE